MRSTLNTVQLYAIVKTEYLKKPNVLRKILEPFIKDINTYDFIKDINTNDRNWHWCKEDKLEILKASYFFVLEILLHQRGGFKESKESIAAYRSCRSCTTTNKDWKLNFHDDRFVPCNSVSHQEHLDIINDETITQVVKEFWQKHYSVNKTSPLMNIPYFDVTTCLPQDAMHVLIKGPVEIICRIYLHYCIKILNFSHLMISINNYQALTLNILKRINLFLYNQIIWSREVPYVKVLSC